MKGYEIVNEGKHTGIKCLECGLTSWNRGDVEQKWCEKCGKYHDRVIIFERFNGSSPNIPRTITPPRGATGSSTI